jgi:hypothetical protein
LLISGNRELDYLLLAMDLLSKFIPGLSPLGTVNSSLSEEEGIRQHQQIILEHLGVDKFTFHKHPEKEGFWKLVVKDKKELTQLSFAALADLQKDKEYLDALEYHEKWHLTKQGSVYAYHKKKFRQFIYRTCRKPLKYSDIASDLPERDKVQIDIINYLGSQYEFQQSKQYFMTLCKYQSSISQKEIIWTSKEYHRFYLEENWDISAGHGVNKEVVLDRRGNPMNTVEELKEKADAVVKSIQEYLIDTPFSITNECDMKYSYDMPQYRLSYYFPYYSTSRTYEKLEIATAEKDGKAGGGLYGYSNGTKYHLINALKIPTFYFSPFPYLVIAAVFMYCLLPKLLTSWKLLFIGLLYFSYSLNSALNSNSIFEIKKYLLKEQKRYEESEKIKTKTVKNSHQLTTLGRLFYQNVQFKAQHLLYDLYFESCHTEEYNFYFLRLVSISHKQFPPKWMVWIILFGTVLPIHCTEK